MPTEHVLIESGDRDDAENLSSLVGHPNLQDSVHPNHQFTHEGVSIGQDATVTVSGGKAFIGYHGAANGNTPLQTSTGEDRREGLFVVEKASNEAVNLAQVDGENYLWLDAQIGTGDSPQWVMTNSNTQPAEGSLLVAKYLATDEDGDSVTEDIQHIEYYNRGADVVADSISGGTDEEISLDESSLIDAGHDAVDVPQTVERTVADFEGGTIPDAFEGDTGQFNVQSSVVESGQYALKGNTTYTIRADNLDSLPQRGDSFSAFVQCTDTDDRAVIHFCALNIQNTYTLIVDATNNDLRLTKKKDGSNEKFEAAPADTKSHLNEWLNVSVEISETEVSASLFDSNGVELGSLSFVDSEYDSGTVLFQAVNSNTSSNIYFDSVTLERRETEARTNTQKGTTQLGNEVVPSGSIQTGPTTSSTNAKRAIYQDAPVDTTATQGTQSKLTLLQSGLNPAMFMERTLDGQGGAYGHQLQAPLGRFARLNANLSWEMNDITKIDWETVSGDGTYTYDLTGYPKRARVSHNGDNASGSIFEFVSNMVVAPDSLNGFEVTFRDISYTANDIGSSFRNYPVIGVSDNALNSGSETGFFYENNTPGDNGRFVATENGSTIYSSSKESYANGWDDNNDFSFRYDGSTIEYMVNGDAKKRQNVDLNADLRPRFGVHMGSNSDSGETLSVEQVTVEPLPEVLQ